MWYIRYWGIGVNYLYGFFNLGLVLANCSGSFIYSSNVPLIKIIQNTIDVLDRSKTIVDEDTLEGKPDDTVHTRIGVINEQEFEELKKCPEE